MAKTGTRASVFVGAVSACLGTTALADPTKTSWADLRAIRSNSCTEFLADFLGHDDCAQQTVMMRLLAQKFAECSPGNPELDGQTLSIAGFVHPLEFQFRDVQDFLLIPRLREDCRHPPPPLPDQVIVVEFPDGVDVTADPVWVTGVLRLRYEKNEIAPASYALEALDVKPANIPDVSKGD